MFGDYEFNTLARIEKYRNDDAINQSYLKSIISAQKYIKKEDDDLKFLPGNLVDTLITCTKDDFNNLYYVVDIPRCDPMYIAIANDLRLDDSIAGLELEEIVDKEKIISAFKRNTNLAWKSDTIYDKVMTNMSDYWSSINSAGERTIVTTEELNKAKEEVELLKSSKQTSPFLNVDTALDQMPYFADYEGVRCKILVDRLIITGNLIQPVDFKRTDSTFDTFKHVAKTLKYHFQAAFYQEILQKCFTDYAVLNPILCVVTGGDTPHAFVLQFSELDLRIGKYGYTEKRDKIINGDIYTTENSYDGFHQAIEKHKLITSLGITSNYNYELQQGLITSLF